MRGLDQKFALHAAAFEGRGIRHASEGNHRVAWHEASRVPLGKQALQVALQQEVGIVDPLAHLQVIFQRHRLDRLRVGLALGLEGGERGGQVGAMFEVPRQCDAIFERTIHALAVEGHHRVRGVAEQHGAAIDVPAVEVKRRQRADRVGFEIFLELRDQRQRIGEIALEEPAPALGRNSVTVKVRSSLGSAMHR